MNKTILIEPGQCTPPRPIAFFDRDGILNIDTGYVHDIETAVIVDGAIDAVKMLNEMDYLVVVVSNQSGVARGYFEESTVKNFNNWLAERFAEMGASFNAFYFCPHHPEHGTSSYKRECNCRKPMPGMLKQACVDLNGELSASFLVGDRSSDMAAAAAAHIPGYLFKGGNLKRFIADSINSASDS